MKLPEETYNKIKRDLSKGIKMYVIANKRKVNRNEVGKVKKSYDYLSYFTNLDQTKKSEIQPRFAEQGEFPFEPTLTEIMKELKDIKQIVESLQLAS